MIESIEFHWSGQVMEPVDCLAYIGRNPMDADNVFIATGDSGMGMTHGTIAGMLLTDLICGRTSPWEKLYAPNRVTLKPAAVAQYVEQNADVARQYLDFIKPGQRSSVDEIAPGSGAVMRRGLHKVAVYKDPQDGVHECSAVCPHMGCVVQWNSLEQTWDCPCHGSRFDGMGGVVNGPANVGLTRLPENKRADAPGTTASRSS